MVLTPRQGQGIGDGLRDGIQGLVDNALAQARTELQGRLDAMQAERTALQAARDAQTSAAARRGIQSRIDRLDRDIADLERSLAKIGRNSNVDRNVNVNQGGGGNFAGTQPPFIPPSTPRIPVDPTEIVATSLGILFIAFPLTLALVRFIWKRSTSAPAPALSQEQTRRFDRLEQSVDAIAIEVERISENQRYLTKLLAEPKQSASVGSGQAH
jgi:multidrug efflux pump subunit AcrA (membrane-fusion protein)